MQRVEGGGKNMGLIMTISIGFAGSFLVGVIGQFIGWQKAGEGAGFTASVIKVVWFPFAFRHHCTMF
jgi:uncharacterized membrane protein YeaQ/YmgE (transglycosylase-associated protein family)